MAAAVSFLLVVLYVVAIASSRATEAEEPTEPIKNLSDRISVENRRFDRFPDHVDSGVVHMSGSAGRGQQLVSWKRLEALKPYLSNILGKRSMPSSNNGVGGVRRFVLGLVGSRMYRIRPNKHNSKQRVYGKRSANAPAIEDINGNDDKQLNGQEASFPKWSPQAALARLLQFDGYDIDNEDAVLGAPAKRRDYIADRQAQRLQQRAIGSEIARRIKAHRSRLAALAAAAHGTNARSSVLAYTNRQLPPAVSRTRTASAVSNKVSATAKLHSKVGSVLLPELLEVDEPGAADAVEVSNVVGDGEDDFDNDVPPARQLTATPEVKQTPTREQFAQHLARNRLKATETRANMMKLRLSG